jgi:hypothetical protein
MPILGEPDFESAVKRVMKDSDVSEESAKKIVSSAENKKAKLGVKISNLRKKINSVKRANEGNIPTSQDSQSPDGPMWTLTKLKRTGYPEGFSQGAKYAGMDGNYAKYYLIDGKDTNGNGWGVADSSISQHIASFIGKPFVVTSNEWIVDSEYEEQYDHPFIPTDNMQAILAHQEKFRVGDIVKVAKNEDDGRWYAMIKINPKFAHMTLPQFCSPAIYQMNPHEAEGSITEWTGLHLAGLDGEPAYGARVALLRGACKGQPGQCVHQFRMAKQEKIAQDVITPVKQQGQSGITEGLCDCEKDKKKQKISNLHSRLASVKKN